MVMPPDVELFPAIEEAELLLEFADDIEIYAEVIEREITEEEWEMYADIDEFFKWYKEDYWFEPYV